MKRAALLCLASIAAAGVQAQTFNDNARVRNVEPQYENVSVPRNECTTQWVNENQPVAASSRNYGGLAIGGVAGAVLGNQVGKGRGREAATALGAVVGALAGEHLANGNGWNAYGQQPQQQVQQRQVQNCHTVNDTQTRLTGYRVAYEYRGQVYNTVTREHPGNTLPVRVSVVPVTPAAGEYDRRQSYNGYDDRRYSSSGYDFR